MATFFSLGNIFSVCVYIYICIRNFISVSIPMGKYLKLSPIIHTFFFIVINGHTPCLRLLLEVADNPDVTDAKGQ